MTPQTTNLANELRKVLQDEFDENFAPPTELSFAYFIGIVDTIESLTRGKVRASFVPDGRGGLECTLRRDHRILQVISPADHSERQPYIFYKEKDLHGIMPITDVRYLKAHLAWVAEDLNVTENHR